MYTAALQKARQIGDWRDAAEKLNGFNREDILNRLAQLTPDEVGYIHQGALDNPSVGPDSQIAQLTRPGMPPASTLPPSASTEPVAPSKATQVPSTPSSVPEAKDTQEGLTTGEIVAIGAVVVGVVAVGAVIQLAHGNATAMHRS